MSCFGGGLAYAAAGGPEKRRLATSRNARTTGAMKALRALIGMWPDVFRCEDVM
jgi:hypothetical protein